MSDVYRDLIDMPGFNDSTQNGRGEWGLRCISDGSVAVLADGKPSCVDHGSLNAVNRDRTLWRCLMCGRGCYRDPQLSEIKLPLLCASDDHHVHGLGYSGEYGAPRGDCCRCGRLFVLDDNGAQLSLPIDPRGAVI